MNDPERLRTRLMIAAQKFAQELADAVIEATGEPEPTTQAETRKRRRAGMRPPPVISTTPADPVAMARAEAALAKMGIRRAG